MVFHEVSLRGSGKNLTYKFFKINDNSTLEVSNYLNENIITNLQVIITICVNPKQISLEQSYRAGSREPHAGMVLYSTVSSFVLNSFLYPAFMSLALGLVGTWAIQRRHTRKIDKLITILAGNQASLSGNAYLR